MSVIQNILGMFKQKTTASVITEIEVKTNPNLIGKIINDKWGHENVDTYFDVAGAVADKFSSHKTDGEGNILEGQDMFSISKGFANVLLYKLKHELPTTEDQHNGITRFSRVLATEGIKNSMPKDPIIIDPSKMEIVQGTKRLYSLAISEAKGTYLEIKILGE